VQGAHPGKAGEIRIMLSTAAAAAATEKGGLGMEAIFTAIYENRVWGDNGQKEYRGTSGSGSDIEFNRTRYVPFLKGFIQEHGIRTVVDLGCGDFRCGALTYEGLDVQYTGYDTYRAVIEHHQAQTSLLPPSKYTFHALDFYQERGQLVGGDLCILKDVLQHWSQKSIRTFLDDVIRRSLYRWILICNCSAQWSDRDDIRDGDFRPLSAEMEPLRTYGARVVYRYETKEVSVIQVGAESSDV